MFYCKVYLVNVINNIIMHPNPLIEIDLTLNGKIDTSLLLEFQEVLIDNIIGNKLKVAN